MPPWLRLQPDEITAIRLSLRVAWWAVLGSLPVGVAVAHLLARRRFWGKALLDGSSTCRWSCRRWSPATSCSSLFGRRGLLGAFLAEHFGIVFAFRWTGAALACAIMAFPAAGARHPALDRGGRPPAGGRGRHARRLPALGLPHGHAAADPARHRRRHDPGLRQGAGRVRRHDHLRLQHPRRDPDPALGDLHLHPGPRRRRRRPAPHAGLDRHRHRRADRLGVAGAPRSAGRCRRRRDARRRRRASGSASSRSTPPSRAADGVTALFGRPAPARPRWSTPIAGLAAAGRGRIAARRRVLVDTGTRLACRAIAGGSATCSRTRRLFPHLTVRQNLLYGRWFTPPGGATASSTTWSTLLGHRPPARAPAGPPFGRREAARRDRPGAARQPALLLLDEPLASLDEARKAEILPYIERLRDEAGIPIVYVSHSLAEVARLATRWWCCRVAGSRRRPRRRGDGAGSTWSR